MITALTTTSGHSAMSTLDETVSELTMLYSFFQTLVKYYEHIGTRNCSVALSGRLYQTSHSSVQAEVP